MTRDEVIDALKAGKRLRGSDGWTYQADGDEWVWSTPPDGDPFWHGDFIGRFDVDPKDLEVVE